MSERLKRAFDDREPLVGTWLTVGHPTVAELQAELGFDFVTIDAEHAASSLETIENMARAVDAASGGTETLVRVADDNPTHLNRVLDTGVSGVIVPMVETVSQARAVVEATHYPPDGSRGVAGSRASSYGLHLEEYFDRANDEVVTVLLIETERGVKNASAIADVDGVDALFVGPADLSATLGEFGNPDSVDTDISAVIQAGRAANTAVGTIALSPDDIERWVDAGFDFHVVGTDAGYLVRGARGLKERYEVAAERKEEATEREDDATVREDDATNGEGIE
jgi:2-dehydro-3-deoxyglucarate aldolase/4-hydroxy-2-oxoheptanedioate aldolase